MRWECCLLLFGKMPSPAYVPVIMSIIFAGAPMVNALVSTAKEGNWSVCAMAVCFGHSIRLRSGGYMITKHAPEPPKPEVVAKGTEVRS